MADGSDSARSDCTIQENKCNSKLESKLQGKSLRWVGIDIGGTLAKVAFFEYYENGDNIKYLGDSHAAVQQFIKSAHQYGSDGERDARLELKNVQLGTRKGNLHFIRFPTSRMDAFFALAEEMRAKEFLHKKVYATGGGAYKFEKEFKEVLDLQLVKFDELHCLIQGIHFIDANFIGECYYLKFSDDLAKPEKVTYDFQSACPYPFIVVNVGSGVSILAVRSSSEFQRITGSALGGGTFVGLSCLLTGCETFEEALQLAAKGDNKTVDKLVKDIYGGDYTRFGLPGDVVASSFGSMILAEKRATVKKEDLACATLMMITNNIGSIARMCAINEGMDRVIFAGNFLRKNDLSMSMLARAMDFWSKGTMKAIFLEHEGYFGAVGALLESLNDLAPS
mgnify:FL=1